jgi:hypothetical protein
MLFSKINSNHSITLLGVVIVKYNIVLHQEGNLFWFVNIRKIWRDPYLLLINVFWRKMITGVWIMDKKGLLAGIGIPALALIFIFLIGGLIGNVTDSNGPAIPDEEKYLQGIEAIKQQNWLEAKSNLLEAKLFKYKDGHVLYYYADAKLDEKEENFFMANYTCKEYISDYYFGEMADEVLAFKKDMAIKSKQQLEDEAIKKAEKTRENLANHKIWLGMSKEEAEISRGKPQNINRSVGSWGTHEQWCYSGGVYLYFENGSLTSWQD